MSAPKCQRYCGGPEPTNYWRGPCGQDATCTVMPKGVPSSRDWEACTEHGREAYDEGHEVDGLEVDESAIVSFDAEDQADA